MKASPSDQLQILDIQRMDFLVATLRNKMATLPEIAQLHTTNSRLTVVRDLQVAAQTQISDIKVELSRSESDVEQVATRLERDEKRLADGSTGAKDLEKLQHEVQTLITRRSELEEVELEIMMRIDGIKARLDELKAEEVTLISQSAEIETLKKSATQGIEVEIASTVAERASTVATVDKTLLELYEKIRASSGTGAAAMREGKCDGCHLSINGVELNRLKTLAQDEVVRCEECRCILVRGSK
ncbi:MAG: C4-type zinc ribbon domain-containing protein [Actinomycetes bacterium]